MPTGILEAAEGSWCYMSERHIWTQDERAFLDAIARWLADAGRDEDARHLGANLAALEHQADAIDLYPSIVQSNRLGNSERNVVTLVAELSENYRDDDVFVMPTKAVLGRCFEIGRINLLYMVNHFAQSFDPGSPGRQDVLGFVMNHMLSIMTEEVLLALLSEPEHDDVKGVAAQALARIWEDRISVKAISFSPELRKMWLIRRESIPVFGTLTGMHEYMSLYKNVDETSRHYILQASESPDEATALEEFLFGLTFEELNVVKNALSRLGKNCVERAEIAGILGKDDIYLSCGVDDPLELYRFFNYRRKCATARVYARSRGPIRTFEENFMAYLLMRDSTHIAPVS